MSTPTTVAGPSRPRAPPDSNTTGAWNTSGDAQNLRHDDDESARETGDPTRRPSDSKTLTEPSQRSFVRPSVLDPDTPIEYRFLSFTTPLPLPNYPDVTQRSVENPVDVGIESTLATHSSLPRAPPILSTLTDPTLYPARTKRLLLTLSCLATFLTAYTAGAYAPPIPLLVITTHTPQSSSILLQLGITSFCLGFAAAPMLLAPLSELRGRYPVFVAAGVVYVIAELACGFATASLAGTIVARFWVGVGGSVFSSVVGGVITDLARDTRERNTGMAIFSGAVLAGTGAGPLIAAVMVGELGPQPLRSSSNSSRHRREWRHGPRDVAGLTRRWQIGETPRYGPDAADGGLGGWRWVYWHQVIAGAALMLAIAVLWRETRGGVVLKRRAERLNEWYETLEKEQGVVGVWVPVEDAERDEEMVSRLVDDEGGLERHSRQDGGAVDEEKAIIQGELTPSPKESTASDLVSYAIPCDEKLPASGADDEDAEVRPTQHHPSQPQHLQLRRIRWTIKDAEERLPVGKMMAVSVYRPFHLLFTEPVVFFFSLWVAFAWAVLYLTFGSVPLVFSRMHHMGIEDSGHIFIAMIVGSALATVVGIAQEELLRDQRWSGEGDPQGRDDKPSRFWALMRRRLPVHVPEARLYFTCVTSTLLPIGLFMFGFTSRPDIHWSSPAIAIGLATMGIYSVYLATFNYLAEVYHKYASSALAAQSFCRNILGGVFPLVTAALFRNLGEARAGALLGGIATGLTIVPWVLVFLGSRIRQRSKFAVSLGDN